MTVRAARLGRADRRDVLGATVAAVAVNVVGAAPALVASPDTAWFRSLDKPALYPPGWAFGVVWTLLFTAIGIGAYLVYARGTDRRAVRIALGLFVLQMAANVAWTPTFFSLQQIRLALAVIVVLDVLVAATIVAFDRVDRRAAALLVPYLAWSLFATLLTYRFLVLN